MKFTRSDTQLKVIKHVKEQEKIFLNNNEKTQTKRNKR